MHDVLCEYGRHYGIEYHSLEPSKYYGVEVTRFRGFMEVLNSPSTANARNIFMADIRDVLFQGDPFSPAVLPAPKESPLRPGAALPYVLFTEEVTHLSLGPSVCCQIAVRVFSHADCSVAVLLAYTARHFHLPDWSCWYVVLRPV